MYKGIPNSPEATLTSDINSSQTTITVSDANIIPEVPNILVIGGNTDNPETVKVTGKDGNTLTVERGFQGAPRSWNAGTIVARNFTEYDYNALVENIKTLKGNTDINADNILSLMNYVGNLENLDTVEKSNIVLALNEIYQDLVAHKADYIHLPYSIADGTNNYTTLINGISSLVEGMSIKVKFQNANTGTATLNINGLGAKEIRKSNGNSLSAGNIKAGQICHLVYTGSVFQLLGEGGEYGTAQPNHVLEGITFGTEDGLKVGTMPNRGRVNRTLTTQGGSYTIPAGYHNGSGKVTANFANLTAGNIRAGVRIGGVLGTYEPSIQTLSPYSSDWGGWGVDGDSTTTFTLTPNNFVYSIIIYREYADSDRITIVTSLPRDLNIQVAPNYRLFLTRIERSGNDLIFTLRNETSSIQYPKLTTLYLIG